MGWSQYIRWEYAGYVIVINDELTIHSEEVKHPNDDNNMYDYH